MRYQVSGLSVASEIELPGLIDGGKNCGEREPDATVTLGPVPTQLDGASALGPTWQLAGRCFLLSIPGIARFLIEDGRRIAVAPEPDVPLSEITIFLIGTVIGILQHQRGRIVLHASAVRVGGKAVLFCGPSGAGKSTLAAALNRRGYPLVTDDVCALTFETGAAPMAMPDGRQLKLWAQAIDNLDLAAGRRGAVRSALQKFYVEPSAADSGALPLGAIYALREARPPHRAGIEKPNIVDSALLLRRNAYRPALIERMSQKEQYFDAAIRIGNRAGTYHLTRALRFSDMPEVLDWLEGHWAETGLLKEAV